MRSRSTVAACIGLVVCAIHLTLPAGLNGQQTRAVVGIVRLPDGQSAGDVRITAKLPGREPESVPNPAREIYVYMMPVSERSVDLTFLLEDHDLAYLPVTLPSSAPSRDQDVTMTRSTTGNRNPGEDDGDEPEVVLAVQFRAHLDRQARIARNAGRRAIEVFQWNLADYRYRLRDNPTLLAELTTFMRDTSNAAIASPRRNPNLITFQKLVERRGGVASSLTSSEALAIATNTRLSNPVRAVAIDAAVDASTSRDTASVLPFLRAATDTSRSPALFTSALTGLAKLGSAVDHRRVRELTKSSSPDRVRAALTAANRAKLPDADSLTSSVMSTHPRADVRAMVIEDIGRDESLQSKPQSVRTLTEVATRDTSPSVRLRAVQTLGSATPPDTAAAIARRRALETAAADTTRPDVRRAARAALRRPPG